jgi:hypothetical protein
MLQKIKYAVDQELHWVQPKAMERRFDLMGVAQRFATLEFPNAFGSLASAWTDDGLWTYKRVGFFATRVTVRAEGSENDLAVYQPKWTGMQGTLMFAGGQTYLWNTVNFWGTRFQFSDANGQPVIAFQTGVGEGKFSDIFKTQARVEVDPAALGNPDLPVLVTLGFYLIILQHEDSAAAASAAAAAS